MPKTLVGFVKDLNALKKDAPNLLSYLKQIPLSAIEGFFKKSEVSVELLCDLLTVLTEEAEQAWVGNFLLSLAKSSNFEMTLMFIEEKEQKLITEIVGKLPADFSGKVHEKYTV